MKRMEQVPGGFTNFLGSPAAHNPVVPPELLCLLRVPVQCV